MLGGKGGGVNRSDSSKDPAGTGGNGGNGGNAYAYGVYGSGAASFTAVAADEISASATAGAKGAGAVNGGYYNEGVRTPGADGVAGEEAKAYGVYAAGRSCDRAERENRRQCAQDQCQSC